MEEVQNRIQAARFDLVTGRIENGNIVKPLHAGVALSYPGEAHYVMRLSMFPKQFYYLSKNQESQTQYTVFSRRIVDPDSGAVLFQKPVGQGRLVPEIKTHLEIRFPLLGASVFMSLFPQEG